ncbi:RidA family protein [Hyphobacterium sp. CCMP332]|nr:RidA family protein [Hyphobacterium sp. CCMP332]
MRKNISSGSMWENRYGYSRVVVTNKRAYVAGTVAVDETGRIMGKGHAGEQTAYILKKINKYILEAGFKKEEIVRTRIFTTDIRYSEDIGKEHALFFKDIYPVTSMLEVKALIHQDMLVEIEADLEKI